MRSDNMPPAWADGLRFTPRPLGDPFINEFHRHLGRLVHAMAQFDFNVGLQLTRMGAVLGVDVSTELDPTRVHLRQRLKRLKTLTLRRHAAAGDDAQRELQAWFERADHARALRNDYVHGRWGTPSGFQLDEHGRIDGEPLLGFNPLSWNFAPDPPDRTVRMTVGEFALQVDEAQRLLSDFIALTDKHARHFGQPAGQAPTREA